MTNLEKIKNCTLVQIKTRLGYVKITKRQAIQIIFEIPVCKEKLIKYKKYPILKLEKWKGYYKGKPDHVYYGRLYIS